MDTRVPILATPEQASGVSFALERLSDRLELRALHRERYGAIRADWADAEMRRRIMAGRRQPLARAVDLHRRTDVCVLDATAGLGRDGYTLAALGARVTLAERHPSLAALLHDARRQDPGNEDFNSAAARIEVLEADARTLMAGDRSWDVVYLDPMYPDDGKTALPSKEMQLLRELTGGDIDADTLLAPALACARRRVVIKRPLKAPWLAAREPTMSLRSRLLRFDVHILHT